MKTSFFYWTARIIATLILMQTLYFKFSGAEESVYIFGTVGMEPWGRIGAGFLELIASVLLILTPTAWLGAGLGLGLMIGAISMHLFRLGIEVKADGGQLFLYAVMVVVCCAYVLFHDKEKIIDVIKSILGKKIQI